MRSRCAGVVTVVMLGLSRPVFAQSPEEALGVLPDLLRDGDVLLVQGAGNVNLISNAFGAPPGGES